MSTTGRLGTVLLSLVLAHSILALGQQERAYEPRAKKVADVSWPVSVSPDGRFVTGFFTAGLAVRDLATGETRNLTDEGYPGLFSPDGDQIADTSCLGERDSAG